MLQSWKGIVLTLTHLGDRAELLQSFWYLNSWLFAAYTWDEVVLISLCELLEGGELPCVGVAG